jgi:hypothetical protein
LAGLIYTEVFAEAADNPGPVEERQQFGASDRNLSRVSHANPSVVQLDVGAENYHRPGHATSQYL